MNKVHVIPKQPNHSFCTALGSVDGKTFIAYGCARKVCLLQAHTLFLHQITEDYESEVIHLAFARTEGKLAVCLSGFIKILNPKNFHWTFSCKIQLSAPVYRLSWSAFGDCLLLVGEKTSVWVVTLENESQELWNLETSSENGCISPDGRLVALVEESKVLIFSKGAPALSLKLPHSAKVVSVSWKDIKTVKLYMNSYNPNSLLVTSDDGWVKVWSEYYSPTGLGFNIVCQVRSSGLASWVVNLVNLENQLMKLSLKKENMQKLNLPVKFSLYSESCIRRHEKSAPEELMYGAVIREKIPVEWLVVYESQRVLFYSCEGLGAYPVTAINIKLAIEIPVGKDVWTPVSQPLHVIKEWDEVQILGLNRDLDLVRWRKKFDKKNDENFELTAVRGGHKAEIKEIISHPKLPVLCSIDSQGFCRVWSCTRGMPGDKHTVQHLMHWGVLEGSVTSAKWLDSFAILLVVRRDQAEVIKWTSPTLQDLQKPSMKWESVFVWDVKCLKVECSKLETHNDSFYCDVVCSGDAGLTIWKLRFEESFSVDFLWSTSEVFKDVKVFSSRSDSHKWKNSLFTASKDSVQARDLASPEVILWSQQVNNPVNLLVSSLLAVVLKEKTVFYTHEGKEIGQIDDLYDKKIISFTQQEVDCLGILFKNCLTVMARRPPRMVSESELFWDELFTLNFQEPVELICVNAFDQFVTSTKSSLQVFINENPSITETLTSFSDVKPVFHPLFLLELLRTQQESIAKSILLNFYQNSEDLSFSLNLSLKHFIKLPGTTLPESLTSDLKSRINEKCLEIPGIQGDIQLISQLIGLVDVVSVMEAQSRSLDEFGKVFFLNVKMFKFANEQKIPTLLKPTCLTSMEIAWALHSDQQDTFFSLFFNNLHEWPAVRMYGIGVWLKNSLKLKKMVEELAMNEFRKSREPKKVALWYMALGKKTILTELFKKDAESVKIYNFMKNDFSSQEWRVKAQKNAFELRRQGNFELSAAFFLLANDSLSAAEVLAENLFDPQLALVIVRLKEGEKSDLYRKVVHDYFYLTALREKDPWLASISHYLLGNYSDSVRCLEALPDPTEIVPRCWNKTTAPALSGFHPSLRRYIQLVRTTLPVRRDCEDRGASLCNLDSIETDLAGRSAKAYLRCGLPILALLEILKDPSDYELTNLAVKKYLMIVSSNCREIDNDDQFRFLQEEVRFCSERFSIPLRRLVDFLSSYFYKRDFRSFQCKFLISFDMHVKGAEALMHQSALVHMLLSRFSRDPLFDCSLQSLKVISEEMSSCLKVLAGNKDALNGGHRSQLIHIGVAVYLSWFLQCYAQTACMAAVQCLQNLDTFLNTLEFVEVRVKHHDSRAEANIFNTWLRFLMTNKLLKILEKFKSREVDLWLESSLKAFNLVETCEGNPECRLSPGRGLKKRPLMSLNKLRTRLRSMIRRIIMQVNSFVAINDSKIAAHALKVFTRKQGNLPNELFAVFQSAEEFSDFDLYFEGNSQLFRLIQASAQSLSNFVYENPGKLSSFESSSGFYQESIQENVNLFKSGLELFRSKDPVLGFAIDNTDKKHLVVVSNGKKDKIREINIEHSLIFKRLNQELELEEEDPETYSECIKQFDRLTGNQAYIFNPSISAVLSHLYTPQIQELEEEIRLPPSSWHRSPLKPLLSSLSSFKSRQEKAEKIASHPMLPVYVTGSELLTLWQFDRAESLQDFSTVASSSKVTCIKFNSFGDKLGACDLQGNFYLYKFDLQPTSFQPQIVIKSAAGLKASCFCFLNLGSVVATSGNKGKGFLTVHDTLMPPNRPVFHCESTGGKFLTFLPRYHQLLLAGNNGKISKFDLRRRDVFDVLDTKHEDIFDLKVGPADLSFFTGGSDGLVKVWDSSGNHLREVVDICRKGKNKGVSQIECVENCLFASNFDGSVKLLRVIQY